MDDNKEEWTDLSSRRFNYTLCESPTWVLTSYVPCTICNTQSHHRTACTFLPALQKAPMFDLDEKPAASSSKTPLEKKGEPSKLAKDKSKKKPPMAKDKEVTTSTPAAPQETNSAPAKRKRGEVPMKSVKKQKKT